ncbi:hypothetical protein RUND412_000907 [Rhizina undulata]
MTDNSNPTTDPTNPTNPTTTVNPTVEGDVDYVVAPKHVHFPELENGAESSERPLKKPKFEVPLGQNPLLARLHSFLPELRASNQQLELEQANGTIADRVIENVGEDDEQYIEMNLGLGVLEHKDPADDTWASSDSDSEQEDPNCNSVFEQLLSSSKRHGKGPRGHPTIEEVTDALDTPTPGTPVKCRKKPLFQAAPVKASTANGNPVENGFPSGSRSKNGMVDEAEQNDSEMKESLIEEEIDGGSGRVNNHGNIEKVEAKDFEMKESPTEVPEANGNAAKNRVDAKDSELDDLVE